MSQHHHTAKDLSLLESGLFADATITCGDRTWKIHRSIICRCEWFKKAFSGNFKEAETKNVTISAEDFAPDLVDFVINYIYSGVVNSIEKIDTNDSVVDACVRLWVIADFLIMKDLENEAVAILQKHCDDKATGLCVIDSDGKGMFSSPNERGFEDCITQLFQGVETAYKQYPHSVPCQKVIISFFHKVRAFIFGSPDFHRSMSQAPLQFSHELFMATIGASENKYPNETSEFNSIQRAGVCWSCADDIADHPGQWVVELSRTYGFRGRYWSVTVPWCCLPCFKRRDSESASMEQE